MSQRAERVRLVGILNVTPDSFSDGGLYLDPESALRRAETLMVEGADLVELGADSTRPGSDCVGPEEEWRRLSPILERLGRRMPLAVDTHHAETARRALELGVQMINDVTAGVDPELLGAVARSGASVVLMHSRCAEPHVFGPERPGDPIEIVRSSLAAAARGAEAAGISREKVVLDTGMGAFVSTDPRVSFALLERYSEICELGYAMMLGCSRKGFLKKAGEASIEERDQASLECALGALAQVSAPFYVRAHAIALHRRGLDLARRMGRQSS